MHRIGWFMLMALAGLMSASAGHAQQPLRFFYCYAVDSQSGKVVMSDMQEVGPVSERASYPEQFRVWLAAKGYASPKSAPYCLMRAKAEDIATGMRELPLRCLECLGLTRFEQVAWPRGGKNAETLLAGKLGPPRPIDTPNAPTGGSPGSPSAGTDQAVNAPAEAQEIFGLFLLVRQDKPDLLSSGNRTPDTALLRLRADLRGGTWTTLLSDDRCPGWGAVAYASDGASFVYFTARGADDEGTASRAALAKADAYAAEKGGWHSEVLESYDNLYRPSLSRALDEGGDDVMNKAKSAVRVMVSDPCADRSQNNGLAGARG